MSPAKIVRILGVVVVLIAAFAPTVPYIAVAVAIVGLLVGYYVKAENRPSLLLMAIALLSGVNGALATIPGIGVYLTAILSSFGALVSAAAVTVLTMIVYERLTE
jgi:hypothetical protein